MYNVVRVYVAPSGVEIRILRYTKSLDACKMLKPLEYCYFVELLSKLQLFYGVFTHVVFSHVCLPVREQNIPEAFVSIYSPVKLLWTEMRPVTRRQPGSDAIKLHCG